MMALVCALVLQDVDALVRELGADDIEVRDRAARRLAMLGERAVAALVDAAGFRDPEVRSRARDILDRMMPALPTGLDRRNPVLGEIRAENEVRALIRAIEEEEIPLVLRIVQPRDIPGRFPDWAKLAAHGRKALPALMALAEREGARPQSRYVAALLLGTIRNPGSLPTLTRLLSSRARFRMAVS